MRTAGLTGMVLGVSILAAPAADAVSMPTRVSGRALAGLCNSDRGACIGYVVGAIDAFVATQVTQGRPVAFCLPPAVTNQQLAETVASALRARPDLGDANAATIVVVAMTAGYPCQQAAPAPRPRGR